MALNADVDALIASIKTFAAAQVPPISNEQALKVAISRLSKRAAADQTFGLDELAILPAIFTRAQERYGKLQGAIEDAKIATANAHAAELAAAIAAINIVD